MDNKKDIKHKVSKLIQENKTKEAINLLLKHLGQLDKKLYNEVVLLSQRFSKINTQTRIGVVSSSDTTSESNIINYNLLEIADSLLTKIKTENKRINEKVKIIPNEDEEFILKNFNIYSSIELHLKEVSKWADEIRFRDAPKTKSILNTYIELNYYVTPTNLHFEDDDSNESISLKELLNREDSHIVILGQPGAGKTSTMKKLVVDLLNNSSQFKRNFKNPIVIRLRELNNHTQSADYKNILISNVLNIIGIKI